MVLVQASASSRPATIQRVTWLKGCWEAVSTQRTVEEQWMASRGKSMLGMGRTVRADSLVEYELMVIRPQDGRLVYEAHPSGQPSGVFTARFVSDSAVVFENPDNDFPQRIGYQRSGPDSLLAWIEGARGGQIRRIEFRYRRVPCAGR
jgi:uncharacterized protein DUF6265